MFRALEELENTTSDPRLRRLVAHKRAVTVWQRERLRMIPRARGLDLAGTPCPGVETLLGETDKFIRRAESDAVRDAAIVAALRRIDRLEQATYESACRHASELEATETADLLARSLEEEREAVRALDEFERVSGVGEREERRHA